MSSDSDFSDDDRKKKGKNKNMDSDDSGSDHKSKPRGKGKSSQSFVDSDSGSAMSEDEKPSSSRKRKAQSNKGSAKKRGRGRGSSDDEGIAGVDGLELTEEDRKKIQGMSEKDREQEIFRLMEEAERRKIRETIAKRLEEKNKKDDSPERKGRSKKKERKVVSDDSDRSLSSERDKKSPVKKSKSQKMESDSDGELRVMPSEANRKKKQNKAMEELQIKRREKEAKKASLAVDAVFGKENDSSSDSSSSASSRSSSPSSRSSSASRSRSASPNKEDQANKRPVDCLEELKLGRLSRFRLAKYVHAPFFSKMAIDSYVKIGVGRLPGNPNRENYRIAQVLDVVQTAKVYDVEGTRTNKGLKLRIGGEERVYRLEFISNSDFNNADYQEWVSSMKRYNRALPTMGEIHKKQKEIHSAETHNYTNKEVDDMLAEKKRFKEAPKNFAMTKGDLMKKLEYAKQNQMHEDASKLQAEINALDSRADELDKKRAGDITAVDWINKRNRNMMKEQFLGDKKVIGFMDKEDDPFTRKSGKMKMVSGTAKGLVKLEDDPTSGGLSASSSTSNLSAPIATPSSLPLKSLASKTPDLFSFHSISVGHDELDLNTLRTPVTEDTTSRALHSVTPATGGRPLSLADYKKRKEAKALQAQ